MPNRSLRINGHPTSLSLEEPFWVALRDIAFRQGVAVSTLVTTIDAGRGEDAEGSLSSALRIYILKWFQHGPH